MLLCLFLFQCPLDAPEIFFLQHGGDTGTFFFMLFLQDTPGIPQKGHHVIPLIRDQKLHPDLRAVELFLYGRKQLRDPPSLPGTDMCPVAAFARHGGRIIDLIIDIDAGGIPCAQLLERLPPDGSDDVALLALRLPLP